MGKNVGEQITGVRRTLNPLCPLLCTDKYHLMQISEEKSYHQYFRQSFHFKTLVITRKYNG